LNSPFLSVVVPAFNEESRIAPCIERLRAALPDLVASWEIVVADDGSRDRTAEIVESMAASEPRIHLLRLAHRGKGSAVRAGMIAARGEWRFLADADLAMPPDNLQRFLDAARSAEAPDVIIGSREAAGSHRIDEPWIRHLIGRFFNWMVRLVVLPGITDSQCGFKMLSGRAAETICPHLTIDGFAFDVEMLTLARRAGFGIREVGITWYGDQDSRVAFGRGAAAFADILRIKWHVVRGVYSGLPVRSPIERIGPLSVRAWAYVLTAITAAALAYDLMRIPVQVFDSLEEILAAQRSPSIGSSFINAAYNAAYLRPLRIATIKVLFDVSGGHYWLTYRGFHALLMVACLVLFIRALRVRTAIDLVAAAFALMVLTGLHTFRTTVQEAFPINHFLEMVVCALAALNLAQARPRPTIDVAAQVLFAAAALTLESGLLVWVVACACWALGLRGISRWGIAAMTLLLGAYLYARFIGLSVGVPGLIERSSGFGFSVLEPSDLQARFGDRLMVFYAYNVLASALSVLFSEPSSGVFVALKSWLNGSVPLRESLAVGSSLRQRR
jgi:dolichyl-phosphate beta-glucosyltransferase